MFYILDNKIVSNSFPRGFEDLCVIVDVSAGLMKYGEIDYIKSYYMELMKMYSSLNKESFIRDMKSLGFTVDKESTKCNILFINIDELELDISYKVKFLNYMINHSLCGRKVKELLEGSSNEMEEFLDSVD